MYEGGITLVVAVRLLAARRRFRRVRGSLQRIHDSLERGDTFGEALAHERHVFPVFFVHFVMAGERAGVLGDVLRESALYFEERLDMRRQLLRQATYPLMILGVIIAMPLLSDLLRLATGLADSSPLALLSPHAMGYAFLIIELFAIYGVYRLLKRLGWWQVLTAPITAYVWPLNRLFGDAARTRFFRAMSLMSRAGLNPHHCLGLAISAADHFLIGRDLGKAEPHLRAGHTWAEAFAECRSINVTAREMIAVGEASGRLDEMFGRIADYTAAKARHQIFVFIAALEGGLILVLAPMSIVRMPESILSIFQQILKW